MGGAVPPSARRPTPGQHVTRVGGALTLHRPQLTLLTVPVGVLIVYTPVFSCALQIQKYTVIHRIMLFGNSFHVASFVSKQRVNSDVKIVTSDGLLILAFYVHSCEMQCKLWDNAHDFLQILHHWKDKELLYQIVMILMILIDSVNPNHFPLSQNHRRTLHSCHCRQHELNGLFRE